MPRPMRGPIEKSKDFKGSMKKLIISLNKWRYTILFCILLAMLSAIISLIVPNRLSDLTDTITAGISPNISSEVIQSIMNDENISDVDKLQLSSLIEEAKSEDTSKASEQDSPAISIFTLILLTILILYH